MKFNTKIIHGGLEDVDPAYHSVMPPIYQTTTFAQNKDDKHSPFQYARVSHPTRFVLEASLAVLEQGKYAVSYSSGIAAIDAVLKLLKSGDEVVTTTNIYGGTYRIFNQIFSNYGIKFHFVDLTKDTLEKHITSRTKLIWIETPTNPILSIVDIKAISALTKKNNILLAVDNTFASPYLQQPLLLGADIVMHSASKYLGGHSDVILGALVVNDKALADRLYFIQKATGAIPGPMDCYLVYRGIKTLHLRMQRHCENAKAVAEYLQRHPKVGQVYWPGFPTHPNHHIAKTQMKDFGGVVSFSLKASTQDAALEFIAKLKIITLAESLGGVESIIGHSASMSHASIPKDVRLQMGISDSLMRFSVGIEDQEDLITDLKQALA
jgi:cystathionine beta-lyase